MIAHQCSQAQLSPARGGHETTRARFGLAAGILLTCSLLGGLPAAAQSWTYAIFSDSQGSSSTQINSNILAEIAIAISNDHPDLAICQGDLVYAGTEDRYRQWTNIMAPVYGAGIPVYPVRGNHDTDDYLPATGWTNVFNYLPSNGPAGEIGFTYSFTNKNALFLALDVFVVGERVNQGWIDAQLASNNLPHIFAYGHEPAFKVFNTICLDDYEANRNTFWNSLLDAGAKVYFNGHEHLCDRARISDGDNDTSNDMYQCIAGPVAANLDNYWGPYDGVNGPWTPTNEYRSVGYGYTLCTVSNDRNVTLTWKQRTGPGVFAVSNVFSYQAYPYMRVTVPALATEGDGVLAGKGTVSVFRAVATNLTVPLASSRTNEVSVPSNVVIAAGQRSAVFDVTVHDDAEADGTQSVIIRPVVSNYSCGSGIIKVNDNESATLYVSIPATAREGDGVLAGQGRVTCNADPGSDLSVSLVCDDTSEVTVPATVTILGGQTSVIFNVTIVNDPAIDGPQTATVTAQVQNWNDGYDSIIVQDNENTNLVVIVPAQAQEGASAFAYTGRVNIAGTLPYNLAVSVTSDMAQAAVSNVTINSGFTSAVFLVKIKDDRAYCPTMTATVTAAASGFVDGTGSVRVWNNDAHHYVWGDIYGPQTAGVPFVVTMAAVDENEGFMSVCTNAVYFGGAGDAGPAAVAPAGLDRLSNGLWSGSVAVNAIDTNVRLTAGDGAGATGTSMVFDVISGPFDHLEWSTVPSPQGTNLPFAVTITARDTGGFVRSDFTNAVALSGHVVTRGGETNIGTGVGNWNYPMRVEREVVRTQCIYLTNEIGAACTITALALDVVAVPGMAMTNWTIRMKHTALTNYPGSALWETSGWTTVYRTNEPGGGSAGWRQFKFQVPFQYNGTSNVMIDFSFSNATVAATAWSRYTSVGSLRSAYGRLTPSGRDPLLWSGSSPMAATVTDFLPDLKLTVTSVAAVAISPTVSGPFTGGAWSGAVTVPGPATNMFLRADDGNGHTSDSGLFDVGASQRWLELGVTGSGHVDTASGWHYLRTNVTVTAIPDEGFSVAAWSGDTNGCVVSGSVITVVMDGDRSITAEFEVRKVVLDIISARGSCEPPPGIYTNNYNTSVTMSITNTPLPGGPGVRYECAGWTGTGSVPSPGTGTNTGPVLLTDDSSIAWLWVTNYLLDTEAGAGGQVDTADGWRTPGESVYITATADDGYYFDKWAGDTNGCEMAGNIIMAVMDSPRLITAEFKTDRVTLTVNSAHPGCEPAQGVHTQACYSTVTLSVTNSPQAGEPGLQYECTGWTGTGNVPLFGTRTNTGPVMLRVDSSITWKWATNFYLDTGTNGNGTVNVGDGWHRAGSNVEITATATGGSYYFDGWSGDTNGCAISGNVIRVVMDAPRSITARFLSIDVSLEVHSAHGACDPSQGIHSVVSNSTISLSVTNSPVPGGTGVQYECTGWTGTGSVVSAGAGTNTGPVLMAVYSSITWLWVTNFYLDTGTNGGGSLNVEDGWRPAGTNLEITATPRACYNFEQWSGDTNGCTVSGNVITVLMDGPRTITAAFSCTQVTLEVVSMYGACEPPAGIHSNDLNSSITLSVTNSPVLGGPGVQYECTGWLGTGSVPSPGTGTNTGPVLMETNSSITWLWATNFLLDTETNSGGSVNVEDGWHRSGVTVLVTATAADGYRFERWSGDTNGCTIAGNMIQAVMDRARLVTAEFSYDRVLLQVYSEHGSCDPAAGTYTQACYSVVTLSATSPAPGAPGVQYLCAGWSGSGSVPLFGTTTNAGPVLLREDSSITWRWGATNYFLDTGTNGRGSVSVGDGWHDSGTNLQITATASGFCDFDGWTGNTNGCVISGNVITVFMDGPRTIMAGFLAQMATNDVPKWWLDENYPGTNDFNAAAMSDTDGDGMRAWAEYRAGTSPTNYADCLRISGLRRGSSGECVAVWPSVSGKYYAVWTSSNLASGGWTEVTNAAYTNVAGTGLPLTFTNTGSINNCEFFRIRLRQ